MFFGRKKISPIWNFFDYDNGLRRSVCKACHKVYKTSPKFGTSIVKYHVGKVHPDLYEIFLKEKLKDEEQSKRTLDGLCAFLSGNMEPPRRTY